MDAQLAELVGKLNQLAAGYPIGVVFEAFGAFTRIASDRVGVPLEESLEVIAGAAYDDKLGFETIGGVQ
jgi:hypothetical protein